jgi:hypothetical protein
MGCRSSTPLDVIDVDQLHHRHRYPLEAFAQADADLTLADIELRAQFHRSRGRRSLLTHEERLADIAVLQQSLSVMENFFQSLVGQAQIYMEAMDPNNVTGAGPPPASVAAILSLLQTPVSPSELSPSSKGCIICCEEYLSNEIVTRLPCGHFYHPNCVKPWLQKHCTCPTCRYELPTDDPDFEEGRMERMGDRKLPQSSTQEDDSWTCSWSDESVATVWEEGAQGYDPLFFAFREKHEERTASATEEAALGNDPLYFAFREDDDQLSATATRAESERSRVQNGAEMYPFASFSEMDEMLEVDEPSSDPSVSRGHFYVGNENEECAYQPPTETSRGHHYSSSDSSVSRDPFFVGNGNDECMFQLPMETSGGHHVNVGDCVTSVAQGEVD